MCGPWAPWAGAALFGLAGVAKYAGQKQADNARERTYNAEQRRQDAFTADQTARFQDSLAATKDVASDDGQAKAALARENTLASAIVPQSTASYMPGSSSAPAIVATAADKAGASSHEASVNLARAIAALGGTQDQMQTAGIKIGRNNQDIAQKGSFKAGSASVLDAELRAAAHKGEFLRAAGGLAQQIGLAALTAGLGPSSIATSAGSSASSAGSSLARAAMGAV